MDKESVKTGDSDVPQAIALLENIAEKGKDGSQHVESLIQQAKSFRTSKGISFLEVKYQQLLSYLINLTYTLLRKASGLSIHGDPVVERLVELRTVLEKMRPIDQKLKYQIDKLMKLANTGAADASDPLRLKANPDNLLSKLDDDESESGSEEEEKKESKSKLYVPPKLAAVHYDGEETVKEREDRVQDRAKKRALSSSLLKELQQEYYEGPEEIRETRDLHRFKENKKFQERTEYEEDNFVRIAVSKKEKSDSKRMATMSALNTLAQFDDISTLTQEAGTTDETDLPRKKKRKISGKKGKGKKKGFKKRRH